MQINVTLNLTDSQFQTLLSWVMKDDVVSQVHVNEDMRRKLMEEIDLRDLSVRLQNRLDQLGVSRYLDLARLREDDLLKIKGFGRACLSEVNTLLSDIGLHLGMQREIRALFGSGSVLTEDSTVAGENMQGEEGGPT